MTVALKVTLNAATVEKSVSETDITTVWLLTSAGLIVLKVMVVPEIERNESVGLIAYA